MNPFEFIEAISFSKEDLIREPDGEKNYKPFLTNRSLSYHPDAIFIANEMNMNSELPSIMQFDALINSLSKRKRYSKWAKPEEDADLEMVMVYFRCNRRCAQEYMRILTDEDIAMIREKNNKGGIQNERNSRKSRRGET